MTYPPGTEPPITAEEFHRRWWGTVTDKALRSRRKVYRCFCEDESCEGWAMLPDEIAADELERGRVAGPVLI